MHSQQADELHIKQFLREAVAELFNQKADELTDDRPLSDLYDSVTMVNLVIRIEKQYNLRYSYPELRMDNFSTIQVITANIQHKLQVAQ